MTSPQPPRSATDLFPDSLRLSPKQREVLTTLQQFPDGARAAEIAGELGMHVNTVRGHLEELLQQQAVRSVSAPAQGRGRPSLIFQVRIPDNRSVAREYLSLIEVMVSTLGDPTRPDAESMARARELGRQWARHMNSAGHNWSTIEEALTPLFHRLREMGFDPSVRQDEAAGSADLALLSCPFVIGDLPPSPFVCAIHEGFIRETVGTKSPLQVSLRPFDREGQCTINIRTGEDGAAAD